MVHNTWRGVLPEDLALIKMGIAEKARNVKLQANKRERKPKMSDHERAVRKAAGAKARREKRKANASPSEHAEQVALLQWWAVYAPAHGLDVRLLVAMPSAAKRSYKLAARMKAEGLRAGYPDLILDFPAPGFHGMRIEMKSASGRVAPEQAAYHELLRRMDYNVVTCYGYDDARRAIQFYCQSALNDPRNVA
jgi:hypothetical protein